MSQEMKQDFVIPGGDRKVFNVDKGDVLRITALEGVQAVDLVAFNRDNLKETLSVWLSRQHSGSFTEATVYYSKLPDARPMFTALTNRPKLLWLTPGRCNARIFEKMGHPGHANCQDNLVECMKEIGLTAYDVPEVLNIFMTADFNPDGSYSYRAANVEKGDSYEMLAEMDTVVAISNCPDDTSAYNDFQTRPIGIQVYQQAR